MAEGDKIEDLGTAVEQLLRSDSWERRLAEARESRRKVLEAKKPKPEPLMLERQWTEEPPPAQPVFAKLPDPPPARRRWVVPALVAILAGLAVAILLVPDRAPVSQAPAPEPPPAVDETRRAAPLEFSRVDEVDLPQGFGIAPAVDPEAPPGPAMAHAAEGPIPERYPLPEAPASAIPVPIEGRLDLSMAPPATVREAYALFMDRLRAAAPDARMRVHLPPDAPRIEGTLASEFAMPENVLRFYHPEDAPLAQRAAQVAEARVADMTGYAPRPERGVLELWLTTLPPPV